MQIKIGVPNSMMNNSAVDTSGLSTLMQRVLVMELNRRGAMNRQSAADALGMTPEEFQSAAGEMRLPSAVYDTPSAGHEFTTSTSNGGGSGALVGLAAFLVLIIGIGVFAFLQKDRFMAEYNLSKARSFVDAGDIDQAESLYLKVLDVDPGNEAALIEVGYIYFEDAMAAIEKGDVSIAQASLEVAIPLMTEATDGNGDYPGVLYDIGYSYEHLGDAENAMVYYRRTLAADPDYSSARLRMDNLEKSAEASNGIDVK